MSTKTTKTTKKSQPKTSQASERVLVPDFNPRDPDLKYTGPEPIFPVQPDTDRRKLAMVLSFNWYGRYCGFKEAKEFLAKYGEHMGLERLKDFRRCDERDMKSTCGWLARMYFRGFDLTQEEQTELKTEIIRMADTVSKNKETEIIEEKPVNRPNVQEIMRERARDAAGDIEGVFDEFIVQGAKTVLVNPVSILTEKNILPQHVSMIVDVWKKRQGEIEEAIKGKDVQLNEGYSNFTKTQLKSVVKFCEAVITGLNSYVSVKKSTKTVRRRKPVSPEKLASKVKYMKEFAELKLKSITPAKIVGASEVYLYDTQLRKLTYLVADAHVGTLGLKGTTILGYDEAKSKVKTLRKPQETLKSLTAAGKPASRKVFDSLTTTGTSFKGRTNERTIILKVY